MIHYVEKTIVPRPYVNSVRESIGNDTPTMTIMDSFKGQVTSAVKWMLEMAAYFGENPQIVVNGFVKAGIAGALDGHIDCRPEEENEREDKSEECKSKADGSSSNVMDLTGEDD